MNKANAQRHRLGCYERENFDYTKSRYSLPAMRYYSHLRAVKIHRIIKLHGKSQKSIKILDVGCGTGLVLKHLITLNPEYRLTGLDFSKNMLQNSVLNNAQKRKIELVNGDAFNLPFKDETFDIVICTRFIHQYNNKFKKELLVEMCRVLKGSGLGIVEFYSKGIRILKYYSDFRGRNKFIHEGGTRRDYLSHGTSRDEIDLLLERKYAVTPLSLPFPDFLVRIMGIDAFKKLNYKFSNWGLLFLFNQFLAVFKRN